MTSPRPLLYARGLSAAYGDSPALHEVELRVGEGEAVALLGRNGMGKTTTMRALTGLLPASGGTLLDGQVWLAGAEVQHLPPHGIARRGLGLVPEGRQVFPTLTVEENLVATARDRVASARHQVASARERAAEVSATCQRWTLDACYALFPRLRERRRHPGALLSGGEQQMVAIARALMTNPVLLLLDEATEGLAPLVRVEIWAALARLKAEGMAILLVDKNLGAVLRLVDRAVVLERGRVAWSGAAAALAADASAREAYLHA